MSFSINLMGYTADALILLGVWIVGNKNVNGWLLGLAGVILSVLYAITIHSGPILVINAVFVVLYIGNYATWLFATEPTCGFCNKTIRGTHEPIIRKESSGHKAVAFHEVCFRVMPQ